MKEEVKSAIKGAMSYQDYRMLITDLLKQGKTTGPNQSEEYTHYTSLNDTRMRRLDKTTILLGEVETKAKGISREETWLVITEGWCGDAAQIVPVVEAIAAVNPKVNTSYVFRDEHTELIDLYLTKGGRSIPKILLIDDAVDEVYGVWGPRPSKLQAVIDANKELDVPKPYSELSVDVQRWYAKDKTRSVQLEFAAQLG